jgi:hypothetical protein
LGSSTSFARDTSKEKRAVQEHRKADYWREKNSQMLQPPTNACQQALPGCIRRKSKEYFSYIFLSCLSLLNVTRLE